MSYPYQTFTQAQRREYSLLQQVYAWMAGGLAVTGLIAYWAYSSGFIRRLLQNGSGIMLGLLVAELVLVFGLSWGIQRMSAPVASGAFVLYSALNGITLSTIFLAYTQGSIATTFFVTAGTFAGMSLYGYTTNRNLSSLGSFLVMALIGFLLASLVNLFLRSPALYWIATYAGILIFVGLTAYDTQKIKNLSTALQGDSDNTGFRRMVILGALTLYLDFVNLFLLLLRVLGRSRD